MKKGLNIIIYMLLVIIVLLFLWKVYPILKDNFIKKEIEFSLKDEKIEVKIGNKYFLNYDINDEVNIIWESGNKEVVTINDGVVTGIGLGSTIIKGTVTNGEETIERSCYVTTYYGNKETILNDIIIPEGELFITKGDIYEIDLSYDPLNGYITSIEYSVDDSNIVEFDGKVIAKNIGSTTINITINKLITKSIKVNVVNKQIEPIFTERVKNISIDKNKVNLKPKDTIEIEYKVEPKDSFIDSIEWKSSNDNIVTVENGVITAKTSGEAIISLTINKEIKKEINIIVSVPVTGIKLNSNPKLVLKVGDKETIKTSITPFDATNNNIKYVTSSNNVSVSENGVVTGINQGTGNITVSSEDGNYQVVVSYTVNPKTGLVNNAGGVWGYTSPLDQVPERADKSFFQDLASKGKGTISGNVYIYTKGNKTYKYDTSTFTLSSGSTSVLTRIYYPKNVDLSTVNTFTFSNGTGTAGKGFAGMLKALDDNRSNMKTSGIIILIASKSGTSYNRDEMILATDFVKDIVDQKSSAKNAIGGYSGSGEEAGYAANKGNYDRVIEFSSHLKSAYTLNLKNKEIILYSPAGDFMQTELHYTSTALNNMKKYGYTNVTVVTNNSSLKSYSSDFLVINPGSQMGSGHGYINIINSKVFSYACR